MITHPLTPQEKKELNEALKKVQSINVNSSFDLEEVAIFIKKSDKETWLNILKMAERANELMEEKWRKSGPRGIDIL